MILSRNSPSSNPRSRVNSYPYLLAIPSVQCNATVLSVCRNALYSKHRCPIAHNTWIPHDTIRYGTCNECLSKNKKKSGQPWRVGDAAVGRGTSGQTTTESGRRPCSCLNCSSWRLAEKTGRGFQLNRPSGPLDHIASQWTELNRRRAVSRDF